MLWRLVRSSTRTLRPARASSGDRKRKWIGDICGARISYPASRISLVKEARTSMWPALAPACSSRAAADAGSSCSAVSTAADTRGADEAGAAASRPAASVPSRLATSDAVPSRATASDSARAVGAVPSASVARGAGAQRSATAASRERRRILAAPRFETSSILRTVCTSPRPSRISWTWSAVMASTPQPKELSWTISRSGSSPTRAAASYRREW